MIHLKSQHGRRYLKLNSADVEAQGTGDEMDRGGTTDCCFINKCFTEVKYRLPPNREGKDIWPPCLRI